MSRILAAAAIAALSTGVLTAPALALTDTPAIVAIADHPTIDSPIKDLLADPATAAILDKHLPGIADHPARPQFEGMTLAEVMPYSEGAITEDIIDAIDADIKALED